MTTLRKLAIVLMVVSVLATCGFLGWRVLRKMWFESLIEKLGDSNVDVCPMGGTGRFCDCPKCTLQRWWYSGSAAFVIKALERHRSPKVRAYAASIIHNRGDNMSQYRGDKEDPRTHYWEAMEALVKGLDDPDDEVVSTCCWALSYRDDRRTFAPWMIFDPADSHYEEEVRYCQRWWKAWLEAKRPRR